MCQYREHLQYLINLVVVLVLELVSLYSPFTTRFKDYILRPSGPNTALKLHLVPLGPTATTGPDVAIIKVDSCVCGLWVDWCSIFLCRNNAERQLVLAWQLTVIPFLFSGSFAASFMVRAYLVFWVLNFVTFCFS